MQFGILVALVAAVAISENSRAEPVDAVLVRLLLALSSVAAVVAFAAIGSTATARRMRRSRSESTHWHVPFEWLKRVHLALWLTMVAVVLGTLHWPRIVQFNWGLEHAVLVKDLLILAPVWLPLLLSWAAFYEVEGAARDDQRRDMPHGRGAPRAWGRRGRFVWAHARHYLGLGILPVLALLLFEDLVTLVLPDWPGRDRAWLLYLPPLAALALGFPLLISRIWRTTPLPSCPLRQRLEMLAQQMGVGCREFKVWQTDGHVLNAAVAGLLPSVRYVFLTDALLRQLDDHEIEAVTAHEFGHVRRRHLLLRMLMLFLPLWLLACLQTVMPQTAGHVVQWLHDSSAQSTPWSGLAVPLATLISATILLGWYSRLLEHDADLCVLHTGRAEHFVAALERLCLLTGGRRHQRSWLHPSTARRLDLLVRAMSDPLVATHHHRLVNNVTVLLAAAWLLAPFAACLA